MKKLIEVALPWEWSKSFNLALVAGKKETSKNLCFVLLHFSEGNNYPVFLWELSYKDTMEIGLYRL